MTLDNSKDRLALFGGLFGTVIVSVLSVRLLFSEERTVRLTGVALLVVFGVQIAVFGWLLFRSRTR